MKIRINLWSSRLVHVGSFAQSQSALGSASSFKVPYQVLCVSQLPLRQPCVFPTHFLLGNLSYPSLTNKLLDLPLLPLFRCRYAGLILLQEWLGGWRRKDPRQPLQHNHHRRQYSPPDAAEEQSCQKSANEGVQSGG